MAKKEKAKAQKRVRYAIYTRYSSEMQNDLSLEAQENRCRKMIAERDGAVVAVYSDGAKSGWSLDREGFREMRSAAEHCKFDAIMFWKFDRLARNHEHAVMIKMLLRHEYGLKLYCVEGFSEDEDDSPYSAMMEQMLAVFSAFYSKNLSSETKRGKRQRAMNGKFNGSIAPLGYYLVSAKNSTLDKPAGLYIDDPTVDIVKQAFEMYATGEYSDHLISGWLNAQPAIQKHREGRIPLGKETIRDLLQNRVYTGRVPHVDTQYRGSLGQGRKSGRGRKEWFEGRHKAIITDELFDHAQEVRRQLTKTRKLPTVMHTYLLNDRVYCARCASSKPPELADKNYGKMRASWDNRINNGHYRCLARDRGYHKCEQGYVLVDDIDEQVVYELSRLEIPHGFRERVEAAVRDKLEHAQALQKMEDLRQVMERIDFSWEQGFISPEEYVNKRSQLLREIESYRPIDYDHIMEAADLLENFQTYWDACADMDSPMNARKQLLAKIVERLFVYDNDVVGIALHGDFGVVIDENVTVPSEVIEMLVTETKKGGSHDMTSTQNGNDGI